jgi:hypothetical protein
MSDDALGTPRQEGINGKGTSAILSTDIEVGENNTIYFDTGLKFSQLGTAENGPLSIQESIGTLMPGKKGDATPTTPTTDVKVIGIEYGIENKEVKLDSPQGEISTPIIDYQAAPKESYEGTKVKVLNATDNTVEVEVTYPDGEKFTETFDRKDFENKVFKLSTNIATPEVKTTPVSLDINVQPLENSTADALKGTEDVMNSIYGDIFGVSTPAPKVTPTPVSKPTPSTGKIFMTPEEAGLSEEDLIGNLYEDYTEDPNAPAEAEDLAQKCQTYTPNK